MWSYLSDGLVELHVPEPGEWLRIRALVHQYEDIPMDLADASLVVAAERMGSLRIFTVDGHFRAYRIEGLHAFDVMP